MSAIFETTGPERATSEIGCVDRWTRGLVLKLLNHIQYGRLALLEGETSHEFGEPMRDGVLTARIHIHDARCFRAIALRGSIGAAEAYMQGDWSCDDLVSLIQIIVRNERVFEEVDKGWSRLAAPFARLRHWLRRNTRAGSRRNIASHYDLGNVFYALFLDETMTYSCGLFETETSTLREASIAKYDRICKKLNLTASDHVLEIGTGWGGFALHAAGVYGCKVTTTTLSKEQQALARQRVQDGGLQDRVDVILQDYRDLRGAYSKIVSIEMVEAVGYEFLETFFKRCSELLAPDGMMLLQAITISDHRFDAYRRSADFINTYIFPGGCLPSVAAMSSACARATDLRMFHLEDFTPHYATTLNAWRRRFLEQRDGVRQLGFSEEFMRMWEYYLAYCEGGFLERYTGLVQILLTKPQCRRAPIVPSLD